MASRAPVSSLSLFRETRTDLEPIHPSSLIQIQVPSTSTFSVRPRQQRRIFNVLPSYKDEDSFARNVLASSSSLYFGKANRHPRSFLWRILQDGKVLEIRSVDLSRSAKETRDASLIIQLCFPNPTRHGGVALADAADHNVLSVFALSKAGELYTFALRKDFFCHAPASEEDVSRWCKVFKPATFSISTPHSLVAGSSTRLIVSLNDGRLLQLTRQKVDDGSKWLESTYGDGQWASSLRGLVRWQGSNTVKYDGCTLEQGTPTALALSPDGKHTFAVCLNHTLRVWNMEKATSVFSEDLLWQHREPNDIPKVMLEPNSPNVLQLFETYAAKEGDLYYVVTFSPHDFGEFKFWGIRDPDHAEKGIRNLYGDHSLKPPDPDPSPDSKAIWKVADFKIKNGQRGQSLEIWVLMRSNRQYKLYNLKFDIHDLPEVWQNQWSMVASEDADSSSAPYISDADAEDCTDKWPKFLLQPGKYPVTVVETALATYCSERSLTLPNPGASLIERMCLSIATQVQSRTSREDFERYRRVTEQEWTLLWQDIRDLDKRRWDLLALHYDNDTQMPIIAFADGLSAIRTCDKIDIVSINSSTTLSDSRSMLEAPSIETDPGNEPKLPEELAAVIGAAADFRQMFSSNLRRNISFILAEELWLDPSYSIPIRIQTFHDRCNFSEEIGSAAFDQLATTLDRVGGFDGLETGTFLAILSEFFHNLPPEPTGVVHSSFGRKLTVSGAQGMITTRKQLLIDLLALVVFVEMEVDREETPMLNFDAPQVYAALLDMHRQYEIMQWLARNSRVEKLHGRTKPANTAIIAKDDADNSSKVSSVLENLFALDLPAQSIGMQSQSEALTNSILDLLKWTIGNNDPTITWEQVAVFVQTNLLVNNNINLASAFLQYQPSTAWAIYFRGRLCLLKGEVTEAAIYFKKAAYKLSRPPRFDYKYASHGLLSLDDANLFGTGLPNYYTHIYMLFDSTSHNVQMSHFAHLALQLSPANSPSSDQATTLLSSLFQASLQITDFPAAYSALVRHPNPDTLLPSLISSILATPNATPHLLSLPFPPTLHGNVDSILAAHKKNPNILAAWRLHHNNYRGAAAALLPALQAQRANIKRADEGLENEYLAVINLLACAGKENAWLLSEGPGAKGKGVGKRTVITIEDVRRDYQRELDRRSVIENGRFGFGGGGEDEMDLF